MEDEGAGDRAIGDMDVTALRDVGDKDRDVAAPGDTGDGDIGDTCAAGGITITVTAPPHGG